MPLEANTYYRYSRKKGQSAMCVNLADVLRSLSTPQNIWSGVKNLRKPLAMSRNDPKLHTSRRVYRVSYITVISFYFSLLIRSKRTSIVS